MKMVSERLRSIISGNSGTSIPKKNHPFDCIRSRKGIMRELMISKESGNLLGLISPSLGEGIFLILVEALDSENSEDVVVFQKYQITDGQFQLSRKLNINEIKGVCTFSYNYQVKTL